MTTEPPAPSRRRRRRRLIIAAVLAVFAFLAYRYDGALSLSALAAREAELLAYARENTAAVVLGLFVVYVAAAALAVPIATPLTLVAAWLFRRLFGPAAGFAAAVTLVSLAAPAGATVAFLLSRYLFRDAVRRRFAGRIERFDAALERDGPLYLFSLRLTPAVPFFVINLVMGLTPLRARTFWWVTTVGMLPATCVFVFAGGQVPTLAELERRGVGGILWPGPIVALLLLAAFPWVARWSLRKFRSLRTAPTSGPPLPGERGQG